MVAPLSFKKKNYFATSPKKLSLYWFESCVAILLVSLLATSSSVYSNFGLLEPLQLVLYFDAQKWKSVQS